MKQTRVLFFAAIATSICMEIACTQANDSKCQNCKPQQKPSDSQADKVMIAGFLSAFASLLQVFAQPKDTQTTQNIISGGVNFVQSVAAVVANEARRSVELGLISAEELLRYVTDECQIAHVDAQLTDDLTRAIKAEFYKSTILSEETRARYSEFAE